MFDPVLTGFILYLILILCVGVWSYKKTQNLDDFALGGRKLGPWKIAISERASGESAWLIIGLPGLAFTTGMFGIWTVLGVIIGTILSWYLVAPRLRQVTGEQGALTLPEYFAFRFQGSRLLRFSASLIITFFFTLYVAAQFAGAGKVLNVTFGIDPFHGILIGSVIIFAYTLLGGFIAVTYTDLVQAVIMIMTLVVLPMVGYLEWTRISQDVNLIETNTLLRGNSVQSTAIGIAGGLSWGIGYLGQPHLIARYMAIDSVKSIMTARRIAIIWSFPAFLGALAIGIIGRGLLESGGILKDGSVITALADSEQLMPLMAQNLLPTWLAGVIISGAIAAMMSTADSQLLVTSTVLTEDVVNELTPHSKRRWSLLTISRLMTLCVSLVAFYLAVNSEKMIFDMVSYAWGGLGAAFGPSLVLSLWWKKSSKAGVLLCFIVGTLFTIVDMSSGLITTRLTAPVFATIAMILGSLAIPDQTE